MVFYAGVRGGGVGKGSGRAQRLAEEQQRPELLERGFTTSPVYAHHVGGQQPADPWAPHPTDVNRQTVTRA